ncbi:type II secretion system F family protein [Brevibacterium sp. 50QC2O2]|uniref:type II secretion system F family protein n=1 Tax=Brevibacterium sp. 50QC2O2 TaxID=2968459 RepID=UPI00211CE8BF|nr:type II secretion system F family protein [Brevibacterium sp. 50QC2O2]MCQ9387223.1 type II secretion system F family protein [Brevibacterium sp. 50QC2O2]
MTFALCCAAGLLIACAVCLWGSPGHRRLRGLLAAAAAPGIRRADGADAPAEAGGADDPGKAGAAGGTGEPGRGGTATDLAFELELVAICLDAGLPTARALELAAESRSTAGAGLQRLARAVVLGEPVAEGPLKQVAELIVFSSTTGVALAPLLRGLAGDLGRGEHRRRQLAAARLGTQLVIPLGVCILPAFILMGVVPVLLSLVEDFGGLFG